nr:uracil-DNA glycosylase [Candidatus Njordarchaeota archaeon]
MSDKVLELVEQINQEVRECTKCELHKERKNAVPGDGNVRTRIMFIGEAPGQDEDLQGRPFVGAAGKLLSQLLSSIGLRRDDVYITNIVKCRPPGNRPPRVGEISACSEYLERQIRIINPKTICPMGNVALKTFLGKDSSISKVHGQRNQSKEGRVIFPLYHPAAALYVGGLKTVLEEDFRQLKEKIS